MITLGKYAELNEKFLIPLTIQVSHAIVDGCHISLFYNKLQEKLNSVKENSL
jgi:chloramphenicol O-acetyltransferase type A